MSSEMEVTDGIPGPRERLRSDGGLRLTAEEMDTKRKQNIAYEYLCHLEEAKVWMQACINEELPPTTELEEGLRNGVFLAKLGHFLSPQVVPLKRIYDKEQTRFQSDAKHGRSQQPAQRPRSAARPSACQYDIKFWKTDEGSESAESYIRMLENPDGFSRGLHFRHTDNINHWFASMDKIGLPQIFYPETTDIYDRKNMPRTIYCLHALSLYCFKLGIAPQIQDLYGKVQFTEEEISAMRQELEKYGIQMPAFSKIGGILANELSVDDAALHAAIIAINEAVDHENAEETMAALQNPSAMLVNLRTDGSEDYQELLFSAKQTKRDIAHNKSLDPDGNYEQDVYDELLTQAEIQGNINKVNTIYALDRLNDALLKMDPSLLLQALRSQYLGLKGVQEENIPYYKERLREAYENKQNNNGEEDVILEREEIQQAVNTANLDADVEYQKAQCVVTINAAITNGDATVLMRALQNPAAKLPPVNPYGESLYLEEFFNMRQEKQDDLDYDEIFAAVKVLSAVAAINEAVEVGDPGVTFRTLANDDACIPNLEEANMDRYQKGLVLARATKVETVEEAADSDEAVSLPCTLLTHFEICSSIDQVNQQISEEHQRVLAIGDINNAIRQGDPQVTLSALQEPTAKLDDVQDQNAYRYQVLLCREITAKEQESSDADAVLWVEEIQNNIGSANRDAEIGLKTSLAVEEVNKVSHENDSDLLLNALTSSDLALHSVVPECKDMYLQRLVEAGNSKAQKGECGSGWMMNRLKDGSKFFYNTHDQEYVWARHDGVNKDHSLLTKEEVQKVVSEVTAEHDRELLFKANENFIVKIQSCVRGHLARKTYLDRVNFMNKQLPAITKIQACWKGYKQRKGYKERLDYLQDNHDAVVKLQAVVRMWREQSKYRQRLKFFRDHEAEVIKIQAFVRSNKAKNDYKALMHEDNPPLNVVQKFVHLLDTSDVDYSEEIELQRLRQQVVTEIRSTQQLEHDLDTMDIKIGLLIKNRISLQDVVSHDKKLSKHKEMSQSVPKGLKALSKDCHDRLEAYQYLFYLLQTNPSYLAKLIFEMPQSRTTKFMESVIYSLFNYGSNQREEYLLLKLFRKALEEEIALKVDKMSDFVTGNPLVVKMIVGFNRNQRGQNSLREMLNPLVTEVIEDKHLRINTNPVDVYKTWINMTESQTGKTSTLPYDVSIEQALSHEEVQKMIQQSIDKLQQVTDKFLTTILQSLDKIPYGMRYMAKVLREALMTKFPEAPEKDVLKIVGNLLYYRYINSAIVAPDAFDIINVGADKQLTNDQRRNLGSVAKILQFAAANKGFGGESSYLSSMNTYIREAHEKFKHYCVMACDVEELEAKFNVDQYSDIVTITKPVIYISVSEICDTHQMLVLHQDEIASDSNDALHELLEDLGDVPTVAELLGVDLPEEETMRENVVAQLGTTEITLTLTNKFEVPEDDQSNVKQLLIRTKRLVVDVIACQPGDTITQILESPATDEQEELHQALVKKRELRDRKASAKQGGKGLVRHPSMLSETMLSLQVMKTKIKKQLQNLELDGVVTRKNGFQDLVNMIAQDIRNQRRYRNSRKQELMRIRSTLKGLQEKRKFYESQIDYYNRYVKTCMENLQQKSNNRKSRGLFKRGDGNGKVSFESVKYSASKLYEKGVIRDLEGLPNNQFKNVMFEISATADPGTFDVNAKFLGVEMEKVELVFQDLLQLQYEGVAVIEMFNKARINVNLLIFLLNKKFYGRHSK